MPWFRKLAEFSRVLGMNHRWLARPGIEVLIALDEPTEEAALIDLLGAHPDVAWKLIVNDRPHAWRPPCRAINVGLRHARAPFVLVVSPESAFVGDLPVHALRAVLAHPGSVALGHVAFSRFDELEAAGSVTARFRQLVPPNLRMDRFYGSICAPRVAFETVGGYDESLTRWGGDDDNLRVRLEMAGWGLRACPDVCALHLSFDTRTGAEAYDPEHEIACCAPAVARANHGADWGREFDRVGYECRPVRATGRALRDLVGVTPRAPRARPVVSARRCAWCGRRVHSQPPRLACACAPWVRTRAGNPPRIVALMQLRDEARLLPGCLEHLRGFVDGVIALDDGSTDGTGAILARDPLVLDRIVNPAVAAHSWNEPENQRRLVERAHAMGFDWVFCVDADERAERALLRQLRALAGSAPGDRPTCIDVVFRELWDSPLQYRTDGLWGLKRRARFFSLPSRVTYAPREGLHGQWYPEEIRSAGAMISLRYQLYHLKSIRRADRIARRDFYSRHDPDMRHQPIGYDYLAEEGAGLTLERIGPGREYAIETLPPDLLPARSEVL